MAKVNAAFSKKFKPSASLAAIVGNGSLTRAQAIKKTWDYIKAKKAQDTKNKRMINPVGLLEGLIGTKAVSMFDLAKVISKNLSA